MACMAAGISSAAGCRAGGRWAGRQFVENAFLVAEVSPGADQDEGPVPVAAARLAAGSRSSWDLTTPAAADARRAGATMSGGAGGGLG